jgi:hypothetical protein
MKGMLSQYTVHISLGIITRQEDNQVPLNTKAGNKNLHTSIYKHSGQEGVNIYINHNMIIFSLN